MISFYNQQLKTTFTGETSDITLVTEYNVKETSVKRLTVECRSVGHNARYFDLSTQVDLLRSVSSKYILTWLKVTYIPYLRIP